jgi:hypothetical protein
MVWGQATASSPSSLALLALRRWYSSLTLCSPAAVPSLSGFWSWLFGLAGLLVLAVYFQGPLRVLRQVIDVPGLVALVSASFDRLRRAGRMVAVTIGATVLAWTVSQTLRLNDSQGRDELLVLTRARSLAELSLEQGVLAALTPVRDLYGLGDNLPLLLLATGVLFRALTERPERLRVLGAAGRGGAAGVETGWSNLIWGATALYLLYRIGGRLGGPRDLPLGGCLLVEALVVPVLMLLSDGILLAWILVELRGVSLGEGEAEPLEPRAVAGLLPAAALACLLALPGRYLVTAVLLAWAYLPALEPLLRWQLNGGLAVMQAAALTTLGLAGAAAWSRGTAAGDLRGYPRLLAAEGGHLVALSALAGVAAGAGAALAYVLVLALPASSWLLAAADSYAHYATLPVGLMTVSALVELGERALPAATPAAAPAGNEPS